MRICTLPCKPHDRIRVSPLSSSKPIESSPEALTAESFRRACGRFATGVAIVTTLDSNANPCGLTINSFSSVSLHPPLVLFCLDRSSQALLAFESSNSFIINILDDSQSHLSQHFASRQDDRFVGIPYHSGLSGAPIFPASLAVIECRRQAVLDGGDHLIFIGLVLAVHTRDGDPLLYFSGRYRQLAG